MCALRHHPVAVSVWAASSLLAVGLLWRQAGGQLTQAAPQAEPVRSKRGLRVLTRGALWAAGPLLRAGGSSAVVHRSQPPLCACCGSSCCISVRLRCGASSSVGLLRIEQCTLLCHNLYSNDQSQLTAALCLALQLCIAAANNRLTCVSSTIRCCSRCS